MLLLFSCKIKNWSMWTRVHLAYKYKTSGNPVLCTEKVGVHRPHGSPPPEDQQLSEMVRIDVHCEMWILPRINNCQSWSGLMCTVKYQSFHIHTFHIFVLLWYNTYLEVYMTNLFPFLVLMQDWHKSRAFTFWSPFWHRAQR